jgi:hypothetical protein
MGKVNMAIRRVARKSWRFPSGGQVVYWKSYGTDSAGIKAGRGGGGSLLAEVAGTEMDLTSSIAVPGKQKRHPEVAFLFESWWPGAESNHRHKDF